jgi:DNA-binding SARP family transcriptional activator
LALGSPQQRTVLALLLMHRNRVVATDRMVDVLWPVGWAPSARPVVRTYVSRLRRCLESLDATLVTTSHGYELQVAADQVDADRFESMVIAGRDARQAGDLAAGAALLRQALGLVRGEILTELQDDRVACLERARLAEVRLIAEEELVEVELATGRHRALVPRLTAAVAEDPLRERAWMQLMVALYRSGRQADALEAYRRASRALADELGLVPGRELQRLERMILVHDRALDLPAPPGAGLPRYRTKSSVGSASARWSRRRCSRDAW